MQVLKNTVCHQKKIDFFIFAFAAKNLHHTYMKLVHGGGCYTFIFLNYRIPSTIFVYCSMFTTYLLIKFCLFLVQIIIFLNSSFFFTGKFNSPKRRTHPREIPSMVAFNRTTGTKNSSTNGCHNHSLLEFLLFGILRIVFTGF